MGVRLIGGSLGKEKGAGFWYICSRIVSTLLEHRLSCTLSPFASLISTTFAYARWKRVQAVDYLSEVFGRR